MSTPEDEALSSALEGLVAAKVREQRRSWAWFALALAAATAAVLFHHRGWALLGGLAAGVAALQLGVRAHLRADALRNQAMERILAEALRREGGAPQA